MSLKSPSVTDHLKGSTSSPQSSPKWPQFEWELDQLEPQPDYEYTPSHYHLPRPRLRRPMAGPYDSSWPWSDRLDSTESPPETELPPLFSAPPPPIAAPSGRPIVSNSTLAKSRHQESLNRLYGSGSPNSGNHLRSHHQRAFQSKTSGTVWRWLRTRQLALEQETQKLLDVQTTALMAGMARDSSTGYERFSDNFSDDGNVTTASSAAVNSTLATTHSQLPKSLYLPPRSTLDGSVIPVRQPTNPRHRRLQSVRDGLQQSLVKLSNLKREENFHVNAALSERKMALARLDSLKSKRKKICSELEILESDGELLGKQLRELAMEHNAVNRQVYQLEQRLVELRSQLQRLKEQMGHIESQKGADLSGYRGAIRDVDSEINTILRCPPVQPLDQDILGQSKEIGAETGIPEGLEFLRLNSERSTGDMVKPLWEAELAALERRGTLVEEEQQALEQGSVVWQQVVALVADFESGLSRILTSKADSDPTSRGDMRSQLPRMTEIITQLAQRMRQAESRRWNLLVCAIGAELEAFQQAHKMLEAIPDGTDVHSDTSNALSGAETQKSDIRPADDGKFFPTDNDDESENEFPPDLLVSRLDGSRHGETRDDSDHTGAQCRRNSGSSVPPELLTEEHKPDILAGTP